MNEPKTKDQALDVVLKCINILCAKVEPTPEVAKLRSDITNGTEDAIKLAIREAVLDARLPCESCGEIHVDVGEFAVKPHHTHACQHCGHVWRPAVGFTRGVRFLPGFKNEGDPA